MTITNTRIVVNHPDRPIQGYQVSTATIGDGFGDTTTNTVNVSVTIQGLGTIGSYIISEDPNFADTIWVAWPFNSTITDTITIPYVLTDSNTNDGSVRRVYVAFSSSAVDAGKLFDPTNLFGLSTQYNRFYVPGTIATDSIVLDAVAPVAIGPIITGSIRAGILINAGDAATTSRVVTLNSYMLNASEMRVTELASGASIPGSVPWIPYTPTIAGFVLSDTTGTKRVVAEYKDLSGNVSSLQEDVISYIPAAPDYTVLINQGYTFTFSRTLRVTLTIADSAVLASLTSVWISELPNFAVRSEFAAPNLPSILNAPFLYTYTVGAGDGLKTLYVRLWQGAAYNDRVAAVYLDQITPGIDPSTVPDGKIVLINPATGGVATNNSQVTIAFQGVKNARSVIMSNDSGFSGAYWQSYSYVDGNYNTALPFIIDSETQGLKFVYVRFSDYDEIGTLFTTSGNITATYVGNITYDTLAPIIPIVSTSVDGYFQTDGYQIDGYSRDGYFIRGYPNAIIINNGDPFVLLEETVVNGVGRFYVHLTLNAVGATQMRLSTFLVDGEIPDTLPWLPYQTSHYHPVPSESGLLTVYVQFRDPASNNTAVYYDTIEVVDGRPVVPGPLGPYVILINGGDVKVASNNVTLMLNAESEPTLEMIISESNTFAAANWETYQTFKPYSFRENRDGNKVVFVKFRIRLEGLFLRESEVYSASIVRDTTPPVLLDPSILINAGDTFTRTRTIALALNTDDTAKMMQIFNEIDYTPSNFNTIPWIPFLPQLSWLLSVGNGEKKIYARFRDDIGNITVFVTATIQLNTSVPPAPVITSPAQGATINQRVIKVQGTAEPGAIVSITVRKKG